METARRGLKSMEKVNRGDQSLPWGCRAQYEEEQHNVLISGRRTVEIKENFVEYWKRREIRKTEKKNTFLTLGIRVGFKIDQKIATLK